MKRCDIVIPVWNEPYMTKECIDSISKHTSYPYRLVIIDNGSDDPTRNYLESLKRLKGTGAVIIRNEKNTGFVKAANQGLSYSDAPYVCLMNNDTLASDGWLEGMIEAAEANPAIGILNPSSNTFGQSQESGEKKGALQELSTGRGFCMLIKREVIDKVGLLDEGYSIGYFEETDYSRRARKLGYAIARVKGSYVHHRGSVSFKKLGDSGELFRKNEGIFYKKWGKPVKIGLFLDSINSKKRIDGIARDMVKDGHQVWIFLKKGLEWPVTIDHYEIRRIDLSPVFFGFASIYQVFKRKSKKKIDVILTDNPLLGGFLNAARPFHGSDVMIDGGCEELAALVKDKTKVS